MARRVTPRMAGLRPGTSPPPVRMPMTPRLLLMFAIALESPFRAMPNRELSPLKQFLGRGRQNQFFEAVEFAELIGVSLSFIRRFCGGTQDIGQLAGSETWKHEG